LILPAAASPPLCADRQDSVRQFMGVSVERCMASTMIASNISVGAISFAASMK
jgi:hypothetical protein